MKNIATCILQCVRHYKLFEPTIIENLHNVSTFTSKHTFTPPNIASLSEDVAKV
jgi:hypothetical protein